MARKIKKDKTVRILLLDDILGVGQRGELKKVKLGYARFLVARNKAQVITQETYQLLEKLKLNAEEKIKKKEERLKSLAAMIEGLNFEAKLKIGSQGEVYNSITKTEIRNFLKSYNIDVAKSDIELKKPIKELGEFVVPINLGYGIKANLKVKADKD